MKQTNWYVITGGPSSGKTTLIDQLTIAQYPTAPEIARQYFHELLANNFSLDDIRRDNDRLQRQILSLVLRRERRLQKEQTIFFDRGTPDSLGYFNYYALNAQQILRSCQRTRYKKIFYCHPLPLECDAIRVEDTISSRKIGELIYAAYHNLGYQLIELPALAVEQRIEILLSHIEP